MLLLEILFIFFLFLIVHSYVLYPYIIKFISGFKKRHESKNTSAVKVSILISAYNEEKTIKNRVLNILSLNYDINNIEVLIGSDCSSDATNEILLELKEKYSWLSVFIYKKRRGKASVINDLANEAKNGIFVFTDANTVFDKEALTYLVSGFSNTDAGGVSGRLILIEPEQGFDKNILEKNYWDYETGIKISEGKCNILVGANGGLFAIRRELFKAIPIDKAVTDDLFISLNVLKQNYKLIFERKAIAFEEVPLRLIHEFRRKVRFASTNFQTITYFKELLFHKNILLSYAFWSHKMIRWFTPVIFIILFILNCFLFRHNIIWQISFYIWFVIILLSIAGSMLNRINVRVKVLSLSFYFMMTNLALLEGLFKFIFKRHKGYWQSTPR